MAEGYYDYAASPSPTPSPRGTNSYAQAPLQPQAPTHVAAPRRDLPPRYKSTGKYATAEEMAALELQLPVGERRVRGILPTTSSLGGEHRDIQHTNDYGDRLERNGPGLLAHLAHRVPKFAEDAAVRLRNR